MLLLLTQLPAALPTPVVPLQLPHLKILGLLVCKSVKILAGLLILLHGGASVGAAKLRKRRQRQGKEQKESVAHEEGWKR